MSVIPFFRTFGGKPMSPTSAMPGYPFGPQFFRTMMHGLVDVEGVVIDPRLVVVDILEHHRPALVFQQVWAGDGRLQHRGVRRRVAAQDRVDAPALGRGPG